MYTQPIYVVFKNLLPYVFVGNTLLFLFDMAFQNQIHAIMGSHIFKLLSTLVSIFSFVLHI
jgi:hypothetical protein